MIQGLAVVGLWAEEVEKAAHFYKEILGLELVSSHHGGLPHFKIGEAYLVILNGKPVPPQGAVPARFPVVAFRVDDLDEAVERLLAHNIELPWGVEGEASARWVMFYDPGGNLIELT
ncbi:MAG: VOC family protein [Chloroflexota bacterium]|nr:MAG: VOC family protein [Chloroflexota bacterium]